MTATKTKERPIIMSGEFVRAILDGRKTQTRRVCKPQPRSVGDHFSTRQHRHLMIRSDPRPGGKWERVPCPYGSPGDLLYVRETHVRLKDGSRGPVWYAADGEAPNTDKRFHRTFPSIHMPKWAARIWLRVTDVRVERVQEITTADVFAEGVQIPVSEPGRPLLRLVRPDNARAAAEFLPPGRGRHGQPPLTTDDWARIYFAEAWDALNAKRGHGWDSNPWVWVVSFAVEERS